MTAPWSRFYTPGVGTARAADCAVSHGQNAAKHSCISSQWPYRFHPVVTCEVESPHAPHAAGPPHTLCRSAARSQGLQHVALAPELSVLISRV